MGFLWCRRTCSQTPTELKSSSVVGKEFVPPCTISTSNDFMLDRGATEEGVGTEGIGDIATMQRGRKMAYPMTNSTVKMNIFILEKLPKGRNIQTF